MAERKSFCAVVEGLEDDGFASGITTTGDWQAQPFRVSKLEHKVRDIENNLVGCGTFGHLEGVGWRRFSLVMGMKFCGTAF